MVTETPSREQLLEWLRDTGVLEDIKEELQAAMPSNQFSEDVSEFAAGLGSGGFPWQYWRKRDGRIITGPEPRETLYRIYQKKGYVPLPKYGLLPTPGSPLPCCKGFMRTEQYHCILARGGAKEFTVEQVVGSGWHVHPPTVHGKVIEFPQLEGIEAETVLCDECDKEVYGVKGTGNVVQMMRQHCQGAHRFNRRDVDAMLWRIGYYQKPPEMEPELQQTPAQVMCPNCDRTFSNQQALAGHARSHN